MADVPRHTLHDDKPLVVSGATFSLRRIGKGYASPRVPRGEVEIFSTWQLTVLVPPATVGSKWKLTDQTDQLEGDAHGVRFALRHTSKKPSPMHWRLELLSVSERPLTAKDAAIWRRQFAAMFFVFRSSVMNLAR